METIISALIAAGASLAISLITNYAAGKKTQDLILYRLEALEKAQNAHNNLIVRVFKLEEISSLQEEKIKVANHRIDDLERKANNG